jgi:hypothetical protein
MVHVHLHVVVAVADAAAGCLQEQRVAARLAAVVEVVLVCRRRPRSAGEG